MVRFVHKVNAFYVKYTWRIFSYDERRKTVANISVYSLGRQVAKTVL